MGKFFRGQSAWSVSTSSQLGSALPSVRRKVQTSRLGIASGVTLGLAIGFGGLGAAILGVVADAAGLRTALEVVAVLPLPALALAMALPEGRIEASRRPARARRRTAVPAG